MRMATGLLHCTAVEKIFLELKLFQLTLHSFVSLFQQGQTFWIKKNNRISDSVNLLFTHPAAVMKELLCWVASSISCFHEEPPQSG